MNCKNCRTLNAPDAKYCGKCGTTLSNATDINQPMQAVNQVTINNNSKKEKKSKIGLVIFLLVIL